MTLLDYVANVESYADEVTERAFDILYFLHDRDFINLCDWVWGDYWGCADVLSPKLEQDVSILGYDISLVSVSEGTVDMKIIRNHVAIFDSTLICDDFEKAYLKRRVVPADTSSLDHLLVLIKLHDPVE